MVEAREDQAEKMEENGKVVLGVGEELAKLARNLCVVAIRMNANAANLREETQQLAEEMPN